MSKDGKLLHEAQSPTAATVGSEVTFPPSGPMLYRVQFQSAQGFAFKDVEATGGDDAAAKVIQANPGVKVAHVAPAPQRKAA